MRIERPILSRHQWLALLILGVVLGPFASAHAQVGDRLRINGYSSFEFEYQLSDHEKGRGDTNGSFDADLFDLVLNFQPSDRLRVAADLTWEHGPASEDGRGNVAAEYAFAEYTLRDAFRLRAGKMFVPFGIYNEIHTAKPAFLVIDEPFATNKPERLGAPGRFFARWGTGLQAVGDLRPSNVHTDYSVLVFNGETSNGGINPFEEDDNGAKAVAVRARVDAASDLRVGASAYYDSRTVYDAAMEDTGDRVGQAAYGVFAEWTPGKLGVELEWVGGSIPSGGTETSRCNGFSALITRGINDHATPFVQGQYLDPDGDVANDAAGILSAGVNLRVDSHLHVKVSLDQYFSQDANRRLKGDSYTQVAVAAVVGF